MALVKLRSGKREKFFHSLRKEVGLLAICQKSGFNTKKFLQKFDFLDFGLKSAEIEKKLAKFAILRLKSARNITKLLKNLKKHVFSTSRGQKPIFQPSSGPGRGLIGCRKGAPKRLSQNFRIPGMGIVYSVGSGSWFANPEAKATPGGGKNFLFFKVRLFS